MSYVLIVIITFTTGAHGVTTSTVQVDHNSKEACETMLKAVTTSVTGMNSQIRLAGCYKR